MDPLATVADLEKGLRVETGSLEDTDLIAAEEAIGHASALVRLAGNAEWTAETIPDAARVVVVRVALREYSNPNGYSQESFAGAYSYTVASGETTTYLTDAETAIVEAAAQAASGARRGFQGSLRTPSAYGTDDVPSVWWLA